MTELLLHIEYLLRSHDCVIVPGLGAFLVVRADAACSEDGVLAPASREIVFNGSIVSNDGLLVNSVARRSAVSYSEALRIVEEAVTRMRARIDKERAVEMEGLGVLSCNSEGALVFRSANTAAGLNAMLGYRPVSFGKRVEKAVADNAPARRFDTRHNYYIAVNKRFAHVAAMVAVILLAAVSVMIPASERRQRELASVVPVEVVKAIGGSEQSELSEQSEQSEQSEISELSEESEISENQEISDSSVEPKFYLVVGTFHSPSEAERFAAGKNDGRYTLKTVTNRTMTRVYAAAGDSREELLAIQRDADFRASFEGAWIWSRD